jgi:hypothetical protein
MNRDRFAGLAMAASVAAVAAAPAAAKDSPSPSLSIDPITARNLLAPVEDGRAAAPGYRLDPNGPASGQRARLSIDLGEATVFAITGKLNRQPTPTGPLDGGHARALGQRRDSGKVYGLGVNRNVRGFDLGATYQFSKLSAEQPPSGGELGDGGPGRSHSLRATARIRFRP